MKRMNYRSWSVVLFMIFLALFFLLAFFKSEITTWIWQLCLPVLVIAQVIVILSSSEQSHKDFESEWYDHK